MSENEQTSPEAEKIGRKLDILSELSELYDGIEKLVQKAFEISVKANADAKQNEELYRELSRRSSVTLDHAKRAGALVMEALTSIAKAPKEGGGRDDD